jgi:aminoglycoside 3-N-acetyltransferase
MMVVGWEDDPYDLAKWPEEKQRAYLEEMPAFDPATSRADHRSMGILTEYIRTRPGARRSGHPEGSFAAVGRLADWITANHPLRYGYGAGSPLAKLCKAGGKVLMLGAPLSTITLLHYAENLAGVPDKRIVRYRLPVLRDSQRVWIDIEEYNTDIGIVDWQGEDYFGLIGAEYLASGKGSAGDVGAAQSYLFDAADLVQFGMKWMEDHFRRP